MMLCDFFELIDTFPRGERKNTIKAIHNSKTLSLTQLVLQLHPSLYETITLLQSEVVTNSTVIN